MKTEDLLILGGIAVAAYYLMTRGAAAEPAYDQGGGSGGAPSPPLSGPGAVGSAEGLFVKSPGQETLFYSGQGYSVRESSAQAMLTRLAAASQTATYTQAQSIQAARTYYSGGPAPSYMGSSGGSSAVPADVMTGRSVRQDQPFKNLPQKPIGFK